jgi:hypothetical protein
MMVNVRLLGEFALDIDGRHVPASAFPSLIPGSRLVELDSKNHILRTDEPAFERLMHEVSQFLGTDNVPGPAMQGQRR